MSMMLPRATKLHFMKPEVVFNFLSHLIAIVVAEFNSGVKSVAFSAFSEYLQNN